MNKNNQAFFYKELFISFLFLLTSTNIFSAVETVQPVETMQPVVAVKPVEAIVQSPTTSSGLVLANMSGLNFMPVSISNQTSNPALSLKLSKVDDDLIKTFLNRGLSVLPNQLAFDNKTYNIFYFVSAKNADEYNLVCRLIDPVTNLVKYAFVIKDEKTGALIVSSNFVDKTANGFSNPPPSDTLATFQVLKKDNCFYLKKGSAFLSNDDVSQNTGFFVIDKMANQTGLFVDTDVQSLVYKGFSATFSGSVFMIENLADIATMQSKMISPALLDVKKISDLVDSIQFCIELAAIEQMRTFLNQVILALGNYFLLNDQLISGFKDKANLFFQVKENVSDKDSTMETLFNNLLNNTNATSDWKIQLTEAESAIINLLMNEFVTIPKATVAANLAAQEAAARAESIQKRISDATKIGDYATLVKEFSSAEKWFFVAGGYLDLVPDETKISTSPDQIVKNLTTLLSKIDVSLVALKTTATGPGGIISDADVQSLLELQKRLGLFISTICWQLFFNNAYLALDIVGNSEKISNKVLTANSLTELNFADLGKLSIAQNSERVFKDSALLLSLKGIFYNSVKQLNGTKDLLNLYNLQKSASAKKVAVTPRAVVAPKKAMSSMPVFNFNAASSSVIDIG